MEEESQKGHKEAVAKGLTLFLCWKAYFSSFFYYGFVCIRSSQIKEKNGNKKGYPSQQMLLDEEKSPLTYSIYTQLKLKNCVWI